MSLRDYLFHEEPGITLYCGDCQTILALMDSDSVNAAVTDPPWELSGSAIEIRGNGVAPRRQVPRTLTKGAVGEWAEAPLLELARVVSGDRLILAGYKELGRLCEMSMPLRGVFGWHKPNGAPPMTYPAKMDLSFIVWTGKRSGLYGFMHWPSMVFSFAFPHAGCMAVERVVDQTGKAVHPCQGPLDLYQTLIRPLPNEWTIIDPFIGTGTTLHAAKNLGRSAIGIEIEPKYCEIAVKRLRQEVLL